MTEPIMAHVGLTCKDPLVTEKFYTKYFGFERARIIPTDTGQIVFLKNANSYLELFPAESERPVAPPAESGYTFPGIRHLAFTVEDVDALLEAMGEDAKVTLGPFHFDDVIDGWYTVWVADPDGNIVEVTQGYEDQENPPPLQ